MAKIEDRPQKNILKIAKKTYNCGTWVRLDPSFEPETKGRDEGMVPPDPENTAKFAVLQKFNRVNLVVPVGAPHMWHAAMESKACKLTVLGEHYRRLIEKKCI